MAADFSRIHGTCLALNREVLAIPRARAAAGTQTGGGNARSANTCSRTRDHGEQVLTICLPHED